MSTSKMRKLFLGRAKISLVILTVTLLVALGATLAVLADPQYTLATDKLDYRPNETVIVSGTGYTAGTWYAVPVKRPDGSIVKGDGSFTPGWDLTLADANGLLYTYKLDGITGEYQVRVYAADWSGNWDEPALASTTFTDANPNLDQCANGALGAAPVQCIGTAWENGNLGASKSHYYEGDSIPYRITMSGLSAGNHYVTIEWDTTKSGSHAIDYLTTYNRTETTADPCTGTGAVCGGPTTWAIPEDTSMTALSDWSGTQIPGDFTLFGGSITGLDAYTYSGAYTGDSSTSIRINFSVASADTTVVLAWGGHIATRVNWGIANSAISIPGSPYHTRLSTSSIGGGNQDRSLSAAAVVFPGKITIVKQATPEGSTSFPFTASPSPLVDFSLVDDGTAANTKVFDPITDFQTYTVRETPVPTNWGLDSLTCSVLNPNGGSTSTNLGTGTATIDLAEGEFVTCTYEDSLKVGTLRVIKHVVNDNGGTADASGFNLHVKSGGSDVPGSPAAGSETGTVYTLTAGGYVVSEDTPPSGYLRTGFSGDCDTSGNVTVVVGTERTCTITNNDIAAHLIIIKQVTNDNGGAKVAGDFSGTITGVTASGGNTWTGTVSPGVDKTLTSVGSYVVTETADPDYVTSYSADCTGTIALGQTKTCTVTNNDKAAHLIIIKVVTNDNGGAKVAGDFSGTITGVTASGGNTWTGTVSPGVNKTLTTVGAYGVTETADPDYDTTYSADCTGAIALGQTKTCTVTNDDIAAHLIIIKEVFNPYGGAKVAGDFSGTITGVTADGGNNWTGTVAPGVDKTLLTVGSYAVTEIEDPGYVASYSADCTGAIALGQTKTCTVTNTERGIGCGYTWGYWKNHNIYQNAGGAHRDAGWDKIGEDTQFYGNYEDPPTNSNTLTWYEILLIAPKGGNAYLILAHQYVAAYLNIHKDADPANPGILGTTMTDAAALLAYYNTSYSGAFPPEIPKGANYFNSDDRAWAISLAGVLDQFNNGKLDGGPPHCGD